MSQNSRLRDALVEIATKAGTASTLEIYLIAKKAISNCQCPCHNGENVICNCGGGWECDGNAMGAGVKSELRERAEDIAKTIRQSQERGVAKQSENMKRAR